MSRRPSLLLVSPRPPRSDGHGDQRRAAEIIAALTPEWDVEVASWLPDVEATGFRRWIDSPALLARTVALWIRLPLQVAYVQARLPAWAKRQITNGRYDRVMFITTRAVSPAAPGGFVVDFVDDLSGAAARRAESSSGLPAAFWRWEARRLRSLDRRIASEAKTAIACSAADASAIAPEVVVVPLAAGTPPMSDDGDEVTFLGNLFYAPNHEAAMWICESLIPCLRASGLDPRRVVIAGRRPRGPLRQRAAAAGVQLRPDVGDLRDVLRTAAVVVAPMQLGSGTQYKILDAMAAGRACVVTPVANRGLGLVDGQSALIRDRVPEQFAEAVLTLLGDRSLRASIVHHAREQLAEFLPRAVDDAWRRVLS